MTQSKQDDFVILQFASPTYIGAGAGNDTYLISNALLPAGTNLTITDPQGNNSIQLAPGLAIASSKFTADALQLTLTNGAVINVLNADTFTYEIGANSTAGINPAAVSYSTFVQNTLGGAIPVSGIASGDALVIGGGAAMPAFPATAKTDNFVVPQFSSPAYLGSGEGNDTYLLAPSLLTAGMNTTITDPQGNNSIQFANGLSIASSKLASNALQLTLSNGAEINVLNADAFTYEVGGNTTAGINQADVSYASFALNTLGISPPASGVVSGGAVVIGGGSSSTTVTLNSAGTTNASGAMQFNIELGTYTHIIQGFGAGDVLNFPQGALLPSVINDDYTDGMVELTYADAATGTVATLQLVGIAIDKDYLLNDAADLNTVFGAGSLI